MNPSQVSSNTRFKGHIFSVLDLELPEHTLEMTYRGVVINQDPLNMNCLLFI